MSFQSPPRVLRIKRKRDQDPLQALILEDRKSLNHKRSKPSSLALSSVLTPLKQSQLDLAASASTSLAVPTSANQKQFHEKLLFTLARTDTLAGTNSRDSSLNASEEVLQSVLSEAPGAAALRNFIIPKRQLQEDTEIPNELSDMLGSFLSVAPLSGQPKKRRSKGGAAGGTDEAAGGTSGGLAGENTASSGGFHGGNSRNGAEDAAPPIKVVLGEMGDAVDEYVYDVYYLSSATPFTSANHPLATIGYIRFFDDAEDPFYQSDDDSQARPQLSDDEDSNAEDFYQNDYPSDEDDHKSEFADEEGLGFGSDEDGDNEEIVIINPGRLEEVEEGYDYLESQDVKDGEYDDAYNRYYDDDFDEDDFDGGLLDDDHFDNDEYERNQFFADDETNELAMHRDRIFGKLQKMIDERL